MGLAEAEAAELMFRQLAVKGVLPGLAMMMIYYCAASGIEDLGHQMFHVVCSSMMMMLLFGFIGTGCRGKEKPSLALSA